MAYADFSGKIMQHTWGRFRATSGEAVYVGDLIDKDFKVADATNSANQPAKYIACETLATSTEGWFCTKAEVKKPPTIATGGGVTRGDHGGTAGDTLFLSTTEGDAVEVPAGDGIGQVVGQVLSQDTVLYDPSNEVDFVMEYESAAKTLTTSTDSGKAFYVGGAPSTDVVVTIPTPAIGDKWKIVNVNQDGDALIQVQPTSADAVAGPDVSGADGKYWVNTKATAKCGDYLIIEYKGAADMIVTEKRGVWTQES